MVVPDDAIARKIVIDALKTDPVFVRRFSTGLHHYVYEVGLEDHSSVVVRIATPDNRPSMVGAFELSQFLRPKGVPLPRIISEGLDHQFPYLILERLPGTDLLEVIKSLSNGQLSAIATEVVLAQQITATTVKAKKFGYAVQAENAPHATWPFVLQDHLLRSKTRIVQAGLFDIVHISKLENLLVRHRTELEGQSATAFLHDTTTKNVLVTPTGTFSGIVDVDNLCFGDPRYVVALTMASLLNIGAAASYAELWLAIGGFSDDHIFRLYVALYLLDFMSEHGQRFNDNGVASSEVERMKLEKIFLDNLPQC